MRALWQWLVELPGPILGLVVLVGAILSAGGSFLVLARQSRIPEGIRRQVEENLGRTEENLKQTQEVINRAEETIRQITGGDSYCYFTPVRQPPKVRSHPVVIHIAGKYPLYDVSADIVDLDMNQRSDPPNSIREVLSRRRSMPIGNLSPTYGRIVPGWDLGPGDSHRYVIHFFARNGTFSQYLTLRIVNGVLVHASRVERNRQVIEGSLRIAHDFPRDEQGEVEW